MSTTGSQMDKEERQNKRQQTSRLPVWTYHP